MSASKSEETYRALENLEVYMHRLDRKTDSEGLKPALASAIVAIRSRLFQAFLDLQEFHDLTLDDASKPMHVKAEETQCLAKKWEEHKALPFPNVLKDMHLAQSVITPSEKVPNSNTTMVLIEREPDLGLGLTICGGTDDPYYVGDHGIFVTRIIPCTAAEKCGKIHVGDQLMSVNGISLEAVTHTESVEILKKAGTRVEIAVRHFHPNGNADCAVSESQEDVKVLSSPEPSEQYIEVVLNKIEGSGLGFVLAGGRDNQHVPGDSGIFVTKIIPGSLAHKDGKIAVGDKLVEVDGHSLQDIDHHRAVSLLTNTQSRVVFKVEKNALQRVRQLLTSDPNPFEQDDVDKLTPRHVILHIIEGANLGLRIVCGTSPPGVFIAGIISDGVADSSGALNVGDEILQVNGHDVSGWSHAEVARTLQTFETSVSLQVVYKPEGLKNILAYEPVIQQQQKFDGMKVRPVAIVGPLMENIGAMLVKEMPNEFAGCVPHTTRQPHEGEVDGEHYHFVASVDEMKRGIQANLFIEFGSYKDNLYGTSLQAVRDVLEQGKYCVLPLSSQAVHRLMAANFMPMIFCLQPSDYTVIIKAYERHSPEQHVADHMAQQMIDRGRSIEKEMGNVLSAVIKGSSLEELYRNIVEAIHFERKALMCSGNQS